MTQAQEDYSKDGYKDGIGFGLYANTKIRIASVTNSSSFHQSYTWLHVSALIASQHRPSIIVDTGKNYILHRTCTNTKANFRKTSSYFTITGILKWTDLGTSQWPDLCVNVKMA